MRERRAEFAALDALLFGVTFESPTTVVRFTPDDGWPLPLLCDPERQAYAALGLRRGRTKEVWTPRTLAMWGRLLLAGRRFRRPRGDLVQLGGDAVLAPDGHLAYLHRSEEPADRPAVDDLVAAVRKVAATPSP